MWKWSIIIIIVIGGGVVGKIIWPKFSGSEQVFCTQEAKECSDGSYVSRTGPKCEFMACPGETQGILISLPKKDSAIASPLMIIGEARGPWYFEAQFTAELFDAAGKFLGRSILTAKSEWMTENFVPFEGKLEFKKPNSSIGVLRFLSSNPSGLAEHQKIFDVPIKF